MELLRCPKCHGDLDINSVGTFLICKKDPHVEIELFGVNLSFGILRVAQRKFKQAGLIIPLFHTQVKELPFNDESFDIITHHGGINTFADIPIALKYKCIEEMVKAYLNR